MSLANKKQYATEQLAYTGTPVSLTTALVDNTANYPDFKASGAVISPTTDIYYTFDGSTPSSTNGMPMTTGSFAEIVGYQNVKKLQVVRQSASGNLNVQYFKE